MQDLHCSIIRNWIIYDTSNSQLAENNLSAVAVDNQNRVWIGTESSGVVVFDRSFLDVENIENNSMFTFYPNPAADKLFIKTKSTDNYTIRVFNLSGEIILAQTFNSSSQIIDLKSLAEGIYILAVRVITVLLQCN